MSKTINDGGQAFPIPGFMGQPTELGMTLRHWFAGIALQGLLARDHESIAGRPELSPQQRFALAAYSMADAMLAAGRLDKA